MPQRQLKVKNLKNDTPFLMASYLKITGTFESMWQLTDRNFDNTS